MKFIEVNKNFGVTFIFLFRINNLWSLQAINFFVAYIRYRFRIGLQVSENEVLIPPPSI
jgi:hypothetical protein